MDNIIAVDPGRDKCGVAVLDSSGTVLYQKVVKTDDLMKIIGEQLEACGACALVIGNGTTSQTAQTEIEKNYPKLELVEVDEYYTTQLARQEYWKAKPPKGWRKLLPNSMQVPPEPVDDFVAIILARRFLSDRRGE